MAIHQAQTLQGEDAGPPPQPELARDPAVGDGEATAEEPSGDALALGREVAGERAQVEDVVIDDRRGHEGAPELAGQASLVIESLAGRRAALGDALAKTLGDLVIPGYPVLHAPFRSALFRCSRTLSAPVAHLKTVRGLAAGAAGDYNATTSFYSASEGRVNTDS